MGFYFKFCIVFLIILNIWYFKNDTLNVLKNFKKWQKDSMNYKNVKADAKILQSHNEKNFFYIDQLELSFYVENKYHNIIVDNCKELLGKETPKLKKILVWYLESNPEEFRIDLKDPQKELFSALRGHFVFTFWIGIMCVMTPILHK